MQRVCPPRSRDGGDELPRNRNRARGASCIPWMAPLRNDPVETVKIKEKRRK